MRRLVLNRPVHRCLPSHRPLLRETVTQHWAPCCFARCAMCSAPLCSRVITKSTCLANINVLLADDHGLPQVRPPSFCPQLHATFHGAFKIFSLSSWRQAHPMCLCLCLLDCMQTPIPCNPKRLSIPSARTYRHSTSDGSLRCVVKGMFIQLTANLMRCHLHAHCSTTCSTKPRAI